MVSNNFKLFFVLLQCKGRQWDYFLPICVYWINKKEDFWYWTQLNSRNRSFIIIMSIVNA